MKNRVSKCSLVLLGTLFLASCGKEVENAKQELKYPELTKTWSSPCGSAQLLNLSSKSFLQFAGTEYREMYELYSNSQCTQAIAALKYTGSYEVAGDSAKLVGGKQLNIKYLEAKITPLNEEGKKALETANFCNRGTWEINKEVTVTAEAGGALNCPIRKLPRNEFNLYKIEDNVLYLGENNLRGGNDDPARRAEAINKENPYREISRDLK